MTDCFVAGTRIATPGGPVPIDQLRVGDRVHSYDLVAGARVVARVSRVFARTVAGHLTLRLADGRTLGVTKRHPFYSPARRGWVDAETLAAGDVVSTVASRSERPSLADRSIVVGPLGGVPLAASEMRAGRARVFNLSVDGHQNYFAEGVLVHNKSPLGASLEGTVSVSPRVACPAIADSDCRGFVHVFTEAARGGPAWVGVREFAVAADLAGGRRVRYAIDDIRVSYSIGMVVWAVLSESGRLPTNERAGRPNDLVSTRRAVSLSPGDLVRQDLVLDRRLPAVVHPDLAGHALDAGVRP